MKIHLQNQNNVTCLLKIRRRLLGAGPGLAKCQFLTNLTLLLDMKIFIQQQSSESYQDFPAIFEVCMAVWKVEERGRK